MAEREPLLGSHESARSAATDRATNDLTENETHSTVPLWTDHFRPYLAAASNGLKVNLRRTVTVSTTILIFYVLTSLVWLLVHRFAALPRRLVAPSEVERINSGPALFSGVEKDIICHSHVVGDTMLKRLFRRSCLATSGNIHKRASSIQ